LAALQGGKSCERARVDAAREEDADGYVRNQVRAHGVAQAGAELLGQFSLVLLPDLVGRRGSWPREALEGRIALAVPDEHVPRRELACPLPDRKRRGNGVEGEERLERVEVDLSARQRLELGGEGERGAGGRIVKRLDPERIAGEDEPPPLRVPESDREHPAELADEARPELLVEMNERLGVGGRAESMALA